MGIRGGGEQASSCGAHGTATGKWRHDVETQRDVDRHEQRNIEAERANEMLKLEYDVLRQAASDQVKQGGV